MGSRIVHLTQQLWLLYFDLVPKYVHPLNVLVVFFSCRLTHDGIKKPWNGSCMTNEKKSYKPMGHLPINIIYSGRALFYIYGRTHIYEVTWWKSMERKLLMELWRRIMTLLCSPLLICLLEMPISVSRIMMYVLHFLFYLAVGSSAQGFGSVKHFILCMRQIS